MFSPSGLDRIAKAFPDPLDLWLLSDAARAHSQRYDFCRARLIRVPISCQMCGVKCPKKPPGPGYVDLKRLPHVPQRRRSRKPDSCFIESLIFEIASCASLKLCKQTLGLL